LLNGLGIATSLLRGGLTIGLVQAGYGLVALVASSGLVSVLGWAAARWLVRRRLPGVPIALGRARRTRLGQIGHFSIAMVVWSIAGAALHQLDRVLIGIFLPMRALTTYEVGARLATYSRNVLHSWLSIVMPAASGLASRGDRARLRGLFLRGTRYLIASYAGVALLLIGFGRPFIALWMGPGFDESASILTLLVIGSLVQSQTVVAHVMLPAIGRLRTFTRFMAVYPVVTAIAAVAGITSGGLVGLAAGLSSAIAVMEGVCVVIALRCFEVTPARFFGRCHLPVVRSLLPALAATVVVRLEVPITSWGLLVAAVAGVGSLYLVAFWVTGVTRGERRRIVRRVRALAGVRPSPPALSREAPC
jgi:O-antigen/teichoic acid export membrane protein